MTMERKTNISVITININGLNAQLTDKSQIECFKIKGYTIYEKLI